MDPNIDTNVKIRSENNLDSEIYLFDTTPAYNGTPSAWNATEPVEIQLHRPVRLVGELQNNGKPAPLRLCGYVFRHDDIMSWMDSQGLLLNYKGPRSNREDCGWGHIVNQLGPLGVSCWFVRAPVIHKDGRQSRKGKCAEKSLILGSNETKKERAATRNMKKIELIHRVLRIPMGVLGPPLWY
ncbi:hypothetical protein HYPSUDRAFT_212962 [Hypholoma sublateritium FD-334 SS-4]|uniref:Uncharacterized protein n=1 Tax=Hypholoma sublateritium (strain FD-334 SS-4) TaxID=945553 RepID=A0A0D2Q5H6_HYPSF|nr:hypothetical protein HYPSUDRAFT_212962 [Hypholoma sublateritium FD-334 SS-4]